MWQRFLRATSWHSASLSPGEWGEFYLFLCVKWLSLPCTDWILSFRGVVCAKGRVKPCILSPLPWPFICCFRSLYRGQAQGLSGVSATCVWTSSFHSTGCVDARRSSSSSVPITQQWELSPCDPNFVAPFGFTLPSVSGLPTRPPPIHL